MKIEGGGMSQETQGLRTPLTAFVSHFSCPAVLLLDRPCVFIAIPVATFSYALAAPDAKSHSPDLAETLAAAQELAEWHTQSAEAISLISCRGGSREEVG